MTRRYAVIGNPVKHSLSPRIHAMFGELTGVSLEYTALLAPLDGFVRTVEAFFGSGGSGVNVTLPFKEAAYDWVTECDEHAGTAAAVNTVVRVEHGFRGCNTDGIGLVRDLTSNLGITLRAARLLVLGGGGAVRGVLGPLLGTSPASLTIANRTMARATALVERLEDPRLRAVALAELEGPFDVVINGTSAGLLGARPQIAPGVVAGTVVYDMVYGANAAPFLRWAVEQGAARAHDGLGMLVEQAAEAFVLWHGVRPDSAAVLARLRQRADPGAA
jgi:shikimate dehydrogenase